MQYSNFTDPAIARAQEQDDPNDESFFGTSTTMKLKQIPQVMPGSYEARANKPDLKQMEIDDEIYNGKKKIDKITKLIQNYKYPDRCREFSHLKNYNWHFLLVPLMFLYLIIVAESAEITVKCRSIARNFEDPREVALFTFFELEVFAFAGILLGLFLWLSSKYILNALFTSGPQFNFKTSGVKLARDTLVRNHDDAFIFTGIMWTMSCNAYLLSDMNVSKDVTTKLQLSMVN